MTGRTCSGGADDIFERLETATANFHEMAKS